MQASLFEKVSKGKSSPVPLFCSIQMITIVLSTSVHADKSPAKSEEIHMFWVRFHISTLVHNQPILVSFLLPAGKATNMGRSGQQI